MCWEHSAESCAFICVFYGRWGNFYHTKPPRKYCWLLQAVIFVFFRFVCRLMWAKHESDSTRLGSNSAINNKWFVSVCTHSNTASALRMSWRCLRALLGDDEERKHITVPKKTSSTAELDEKLFAGTFTCTFLSHMAQHETPWWKQEPRKSGERNISCVSVDMKKKTEKGRRRESRKHVEGRECAIRKK